MDYWQIIKRSAELTWRNKLLWVLGILVAIFGGGAGRGMGQGLQYAFDGNRMGRYGWGMPNWPYGPRGWEGFARVGIGVVLLAMLVALVLMVVSVIVTYTCQGALVAAADELDSGRKPTFGQVLSRGWRRFLRLFAQDLLIGLVVGVVAFVTLVIYAIAGGLVLAPGIVMLASDNGAHVLGMVWVVLIGLVVALGLALVLAAIVAVQKAVQAYAMRASVLALDGVFDAIGNAWKLFCAKPRQSLLMWLWLALISFGVGLVLIPVFILLAVVVIAPSAGVYALSQSALLTGAVAVPLVIVASLILLWVSGLLIAFGSAAWTLTYGELTLAAPPAMPPAAPATPSAES